jgi:hypothetical protein
VQEFERRSKLSAQQQLLQQQQEQQQRQYQRFEQQQRRPPLRDPPPPHSDNRDRRGVSRGGGREDYWDRDRERERTRKEDHLKASTEREGEGETEAEEIENLMASIERLHSLPMEAFAALSLDQVTSLFLSCRSSSHGDTTLIPFLSISPSLPPPSPHPPSPCQVSSGQIHLHSLVRTLQQAHELILQKQSSTAISASAQEQNFCCICKESPKTILLLPCRHICLCEECSDNFRNGRLENCPVCRQTIVDILRVYI